MLGRGLRWNNAACSALGRFSVTCPTTHKQIGPFWCWFPGGWACLHSRTLRVSPMNSPVRLEVSPTAVSTPTGVFSQRFEALFPCAVTLGWGVSLPICFFHFICTWMWDHLIWNPPPQRVLQLLPCHKSSLPSCQSPPFLPVWMNVSFLIPWLSDFHTVQFSVSSGWILFFNLLLSFRLCKEAQCVYLCLHLGWKSPVLFSIQLKNTHIYMNMYIY